MSACCCSLAGTVACEHCRNRSMTFEYSAGTTYSSEDFDFPKKKQTNADRIRNMTDEELADFLEKVADGCDTCPMLKECTYSDGEISEQQIRLKWLKQKDEDG